MATIVMTWNLENLCRPDVDAPAEVIAVYQRKVTALAAVIRAANADVVAFQEVGDPAAELDPGTSAGIGGSCRRGAIATPGTEASPVR